MTARTEAEGTPTGAGTKTGEPDRQHPLSKALIKVDGMGWLFARAVDELRARWLQGHDGPLSIELPTDESRAKRKAIEAKAAASGDSIFWLWAEPLEDVARSYGEFLTSIEAALGLLESVSAEMDDATRPAPERWTSRCRRLLGEARRCFNVHRYGLPLYGARGFWKECPEDPAVLRGLLSELDVMRIQIWDAGLDERRYVADGVGRIRQQTAAETAASLDALRNDPAFRASCESGARWDAAQEAARNAAAPFQREMERFRADHAKGFDARSEPAEYYEGLGRACQAAMNCAFAAFGFTMTKSANSPVEGEAGGHDAPHKGTPASAEVKPDLRWTPEAAQRTVNDYVRKKRAEGTPLSRITRDGIAAATGVPTGTVSTTSAWEGLRAEKREEKARPAGVEPITDAAEVATPDEDSAELQRLIQEQTREKRRDEAPRRRANPVEE